MSRVDSLHNEIIWISSPPVDSTPLEDSPFVRTQVETVSFSPLISDVDRLFGTEQTHIPFATFTPPKGFYQETNRFFQQSAASPLIGPEDFLFLENNRGIEGFTDLFYLQRELQSIQRNLQLWLTGSKVAKG